MLGHLRNAAVDGSARRLAYARIVKEDNGPVGGDGVNEERVPRVHGGAEMVAEEEWNASIFFLAEAAIGKVDIAALNVLSLGRLLSSHG